MVGIKLGSKCLKFGLIVSVCGFVGPEYADVVFLVDSSDHLGIKSFPFVKAFINKMISSLPIEADKYHVGLAQYSDGLHREFQLSTFKSRGPMLNHLKKNFGFLGGSLRIGKALQEVHRAYFSSGRDRKQFPPILVVLASAESEDAVEEAAAALRKDGVRIISVGMQGASEKTLKAMATGQFHYSLRTVRDLSTFSQNMTQILKAAAQYKDGAVNDVLVEVCQGPSVADVVFLLDMSTNSSWEDFDYLKEFLEESISALDIKEHCMRVGLVAYSNETKVVSTLSRGGNKSEVLQDIQSLAPLAGKAYTGAALRKIRKEVFSAQHGSRKNQGVPQIAVLVTHSPSQDNVTKAAVNLRRQGVTVFTIGVEGANNTQLEKIASHPAEQYVSQLKSFSDLAAHNQTFLKKLRNQITHTVSVISERTETLKAGCVDTEEADIYLLIDGSRSTQATDFQEMKTFLSEVAGMFNIAPQKVRVGAVQYADRWDLEFDISKYTNKHDVGKAIENIRQMGGNGNTGAALNFTLGLLQKAKRQRGGRVPSHLVVLTSGASRDSVLGPANRLREELVHVYAIGVREANQTQLREISGEEKRAYYVHDFDALKDIRNQVVQEICAEEACKEMKADIMFLVDSSGSIGLENFIKMKTFMKNLVSKSQIRADRVQIGVVQFSDVNKEEFQLNRYTSQGEISDAIDRMAHIGETTLTGSALTFVSQYFSPAKGARPNVRKFLILITDGEAQDIVKDPAVALREEGIIIYSVGVFGSNVTQLEEISGRPEMVFYVENFDILQHIEDDLVFGICSPREECKRIEVLDVVFVIDSSGSIDHDEYNIMKDFMIDLVKKADVGKNHVRFGALKYADDPEVLFYLDNLDTKWEVISVLQNDQPMGGNTYTAEALGFSDHMFTEARGSRLHKGVPQVLIVITDGESHDADKLNATAKALRDKGILVLAVGIAGANPVELLAMAGSSDKYFFVETFGGLKGIFSDVSASVCNTSKVDCEIEKVDLVFLMDGSNSIHPDDFRKMKEFLASVIQDFDISNNRVRIGAAQFSHTYRPEFPLGMFISKKEISFQIENIKQIFGYTHIGAALRQVGHYFRPDMGSRIHTGTPQVLLVLTDGQSQDEVAQAAEELRHKGIDIYSVGIGDVDDQQLVQITGTADKKLTVHNFDELKKVKKRIVRNICTSGGDSNCFVDVVVGFDISTQQNGQTLLEGQSWMETYLQDILRVISSLNGVSCEVGTETQVSVAFQVTNAAEKYSPKFEIYSENILNSLKDLTVKGPSLLNANHLSSLWDAFQNKSAARGKVALLFSDGLDDDIEKLEQKSDELRKEGLNALITIALDGPTSSGDLADLLYIEFGKGFEYRTQLTLGMRDLGSQLSKHLVNVAERTCCCLFCKCIGGDGTRGDPGPAGKTVILVAICPVYPTELVFALDQSRSVTEPEFVRMKAMLSSLLSGLRVREDHCPAGARVAVLAYDSHARLLIRFSDTYRKDRLLREIEALPYERSTASRDIGKAMRFVSRHVFKRMLPGSHSRRIATFFSGGPSVDPQTITTAGLEFSALDIIPVVIAFNQVPAVRRSFAIDDTGRFQVIIIPSGADSAPALEELQRCTFCYDVCKPDASCDQARPPPVQSYVDAAFLLDGSRHVGSAEFEDIRGFLGALLDHFEVTPEPETSVTGDRVALLSLSPPHFLPNTQRSPVRSEFNLTTYRSKRLMKRHVEESVQQLNGDAFIGHALQWALDNVFSRTPNLRRNKVIFVISAGETSQLDRETLKKESLRAKCQGYTLFVFSLGPSWNDQELEDLASYPLDHHLVQLGRIHKPDHRYGVKLVKAFISSVRRKQVNAPAAVVTVISYVVSLPSLCSFVPGPHRATLKEDALQKAKFFQYKNYFSRIARGGRDGTVQNFTRNIFHAFGNGKRVMRAAPKHDKGSAQG
ncbi:hypothetical protein MJT46_019214, partial [Ovis ammon polii x Ovis aries]